MHHDPHTRTYEQLLRDEHVAVWLICWIDDHDTGFHDHDVSCGALAVAEGTVVEERLALGGRPASRRLRTGEALDFAASDIHRVAHAGGGPAITLNAYSPPPWRMGAYECLPTGELQRHPSPTPRSCARSASGEGQSRPALSRAQNIPLKFLENILQGLRQSGTVDTRRGPGGGHLLGAWHKR